jgi:ATP-dependent RNA helicase SUPV3L1/SUV3
MPPVIQHGGRNAPPRGYRALGKQALRIDLAEKLLHKAHAVRAAAGNRSFVIDPALAISTGLTTASYAQLLRLAGFQPGMPRPLAEGALGPPAPPRWRWRPPRREIRAAERPAPLPGSAFAALAVLVR